MHSYTLSVGRGKHVTGTTGKTWKKVAAITQKDVLKQPCRKGNTPLMRLLKMSIGLEVSICTGNAERATLWEALCLCHIQQNGSFSQLACGQPVGDQSCVSLCWTSRDRMQPNTVDENW